MQLKNFMVFFVCVCSFQVMSQLDLAIPTSALLFFTYNTKLSADITTFFYFLEALCLPRLNIVMVGSPLFTSSASFSKFFHVTSHTNS